MRASGRSLFVAGWFGMALLLGAGLAARLPCADPVDWDGRQYRPLCYSDIPFLYAARDLGDRVPYLEAPNEYPVLSGAAMWLAAIPVGDPRAFMLTATVVLAACAAVTYELLWRRAGGRALLFALAPALALYGLSNWDLLAVALATAGLACFLTGRDRWAGVWLGLGVAAKLYPILILAACCLDRTREGHRRDAAELGGWAAGAWVVVNAPVVLAAPGRWLDFFRFNAERAADPGSLWWVACRELSLGRSCGSGPVAGLISVGLFVGGAVLVWQVRARRTPDFAPWTFAFPLVLLFLLVGKVSTPHWVLWLLPFFALVLPDLRAWGAVQAGALAMALTRLPFLGTLVGNPGPPRWVFEAASVFRAATYVLCLVLWAVGRPEADGVASAMPESSASASSSRRD